MHKNIVIHGIAVALMAAAAGYQPPAHAAVDEAAAQALLKQNNCLRCHSIEKEKQGPPFVKVAEKYRGRADAEEKLVYHLTSGEKAKFHDGHEEEHKIVKTSPANDPEQIKNLVQWILAR